MELNPTPKPIQVNTGEQETLTEIIDNFFAETRKYFEANHKINPIHWNIESGEIYPLPSIQSNDRATYLLYKDNVVALVLETRTEFNYVRYTFFRELNLLT